MGTVTLFEIAFASAIFSALDQNDKSYHQFVECTGGFPDLNFPEHRIHLLKFLRRWGCRQFENDSEGEDSEKIHSWYRDHETEIISKNKDLLELTEEDLALVSAIYDSLRTVQVSRMTVGHTGAAKILFAIRPHSLVPWDGAYRKKLKYKDSGSEYARHLNEVKYLVNELKIQCTKNRFSIEDLPEQLGRSYATVPKLVDEYFWVTKTRGYKLPDSSQVQFWIDWK